KLWCRYVAKLGNPWFVLIKLHGIQMVEYRIVHIECCQRDPATGRAHQEFLIPSSNVDHGGPGELTTSGVTRPGQEGAVAGSVSDQGHDEIVEGRADYFLQALFVRGAELDEAVLGKK